MLAEEFLELQNIGGQRLPQVVRLLVLTAVFITASALTHATELRGKVLNGTTRKPSPGDEVVLLSLSEDGMNQVGRTQTDSMGRFACAMNGASNLLVRVIHDGVTYHKAVVPGLKVLALEVYDVTGSLDGVNAVMEVQRFEATSDTLEIKQLVTIRNQSKPPRTLVNDRPFEIQLPPEAHVVSGMIQIETGQPVKQKPFRGEHEGQYYLSSPIRPGDTRFAVVYQLPYSGEALIAPQIRSPLQRFVVMLPQSMKFEPLAAGIFQPILGTSPDNVQGTVPASAGQTVAFRISGKGMLQELEGRRQQNTDDQSAQQLRPGGGLAPPIDAPDPLKDYRWQVFSGLALCLVAGALYVMRKNRPMNLGSPSPVFERALRWPINQRKPVEVSTRSPRHTHATRRST